MKKLYFLLFSFSTLLLSAQSSWQELTQLSNTGPIVQLSVGYNGTIFAKTADKYIYYSTNNGDTWTPFTSVPGYYNIGRIKASKVNPSLYVTTLSNGVAYTPNYGANWSKDNINTNSHTGMGSTTKALGTHPSANQAIVSTSSRLYFTQNGGTTWTNSGQLNISPRDFLFLSTTNIFGTGGNGLLHATSLNNSWSRIAFIGYDVTDVQFDGNTTLYISVNDSNDVGSIHKSTDNGANWTALPNLPQTTFVHSVGIDTTNNLIYAASDDGVFRYNGSTWQAVGSITGTEHLATAGTSVFTSGSTLPGIYRTNNTLQIFEHKSEGLKSEISHVCIDKDDYLYTASHYSPIINNIHLDTLNNFGFTINNSSGAPLYYRSLDKDTSGSLLTFSTSSFNKVENGGTQTTLLADDSNAPPNATVLNPNAIYTGNDNSITISIYGQTRILYNSTNYGSSWTELMNGANTTPQMTSIYDACIGKSSAYVLGLTMPTVDLNILAKSGNSWNLLPMVHATAEPANIYMDNNDQLFCRVDSLYKYDSNNNTWTALNLDLGTNPNKTVSMYFDNNNRMYVIIKTRTSAFAQEGIYYSDDEGDTFTSIGFPSKNGSDVKLTYLDFNSENTPFGIFDNTVYYYWDQTFDVAELNSKPSEYSIYPNPGSNQVLVKLPSNDEAQIQVMDSSGKRLLDVRTRETNPKLHISGLPSGLYHVQIHQSGNTETLKLLIK